MINIIRGTTPTVTYKFSIVDVADITSAFLTVEQCGAVVIEKDITTAEVGTDTLEWRLEQAETLVPSVGGAKMMLNWLLQDGTRGASNELAVSFKDNQKDEVIT